MPENNKTSDSTYSIDCHDVAQVVEFCPFEWSSQLIAIGTSTRVTIGICRFQEEAADIDGIEYTNLRDFHHGSRVTALSWSPETTLLTIPKIVRYATGGSDKKLRIFSSDLKTEDHVKEVDGHTDYINDVTFDPDKGEHLASVSDDHTCRVWGTDGSSKACFPLGAPGMSVKWHAEDPLKIMVAEKRGVISFFNVLTQQPILSLDCGHAPLLSADWCHGNVLRVAAVAGTDWFIFDTSRSSRAIDSRQAHSEGGREVKWSRSHDHLLASLGSPGSQFRVMNSKTNQVLISTDLPIANGVSWHGRLPLVAVGGDKKVHFWPTESL